MCVSQARDIDKTQLLLAGWDPSDGTLPRLDLVMRLLESDADQLRSIARLADIQCKTENLIYRTAEAAIQGRLVRKNHCLTRSAVQLL